MCVIRTDMVSSQYRYRIRSDKVVSGHPYLRFELLPFPPRPGETVTRVCAALDAAGTQSAFPFHHSDLRKWPHCMQPVYYCRNVVIAQNQEALLSSSNWEKMVQKVSQFGIRTGTFNCSSDNRSCIKRGWQRSTLIMSAPQTSASKGKVMLKEYTSGYTEIEQIFGWMTSHVSNRIKTLRHSEQLIEEWHSKPAHSMRMFLFAHLSQPPAFFSSLSVKFTGRIEFIFVDVRRWDNHSSLSNIGVTQTPAYILKMPEGIYRYGNSTGEFLSLAAMDTFLRSVQPEVNDLFVLSLVLINLLAWMDLFITQGATVKRFVVLIRTLGTYNSILLVSWLPVLALLQLPYLNTLYGFSLKLLRYADTTTLASLIRADWTFYSSHPALFLSTYLFHGLLVDYFEKKRRCGTRNQEDSTTNLEWLANLWDWYTSYLLHPIASLQQFPSDYSDWEDDPNFLLERLAFPDLWLRPLVNVDYIKLLPTWRLKAVSHHKESVSGIQQDNEMESQELLDYSPAGLSRHSHHSTGHQRELCNQDGNTDPSLSSDNDPISTCPCDHTAYDWSQWPADMLLCSECVVCLENFVSEELLMGLPCGHAFHQQCIVVWLAAGRHCCPVCRWPSYKKKKERATPSNTNESIHLD
ncbi:E3 ubiquitin-protein ligase RNF103 isoform X2 [Austrofundulus limnaeus]|uniref:E3 ubiquitin-protein ligase RNF103 isoform X2 n=1 Tax=Austrofundulus limnaeus TaxID=52670 RepID=A0A2I4D2H2_AUSLI|nr:PREDICTED: E3 ubiquitin-protein ligase RNF103 isoform X2 [Austrofundulus limnaeus]